MDLTAEEIHDALVEKQKGEKKKAAEYWVRQSLFLSSMIFLGAITFFIFSGGGPTDTYYVPSAAKGSNYIKIHPSVPPVDTAVRDLIPLPGK